MLVTSLCILGPSQCYCKSMQYQGFDHKFNIGQAMVSLKLELSTIAQDGGGGGSGAHIVRVTDTLL